MSDSSDLYLVIDKPAEGLYKEKGSKFLSKAVYVESIEEVKGYLDDRKKELYDAKNFCFAYVIGSDKSIIRAFDDHEPMHSAGTPILNKINAYSLTNILVMVTRYYGGKKLGIPGLIHAFGTAAEEALLQITPEKRYVVETVQLKFGYEQLNFIMNLIKKYDLSIKDQTMETACEMILDIRKGDFKVVLELLEKNYEVEVKLMLRK